MTISLTWQQESLLLMLQKLCMQFFVIIIRIVIHKVVEKKVLVLDSTIWFGYNYLADLSKCFPNDHSFSLHCWMSSKGPA